MLYPKCYVLGIIADYAVCINEVKNIQDNTKGIVGIADLKRKYLK